MNGEKVAEKLRIDWSRFPEEIFRGIQKDFADAKTDEEKDRLGENSFTGEIVVNGLEYIPYYEVSTMKERYPILFLGNNNPYDDSLQHTIEGQLAGYSGETFLRFSANEVENFLDMDYATFQKLFRKRAGADIARAIENKKLPRKVLNCKTSEKALDLLREVSDVKKQQAAH